MTPEEAFKIRRLFPRAHRGSQPMLMVDLGGRAFRLDLQWQRDAYITHIRSADGVRYLGTLTKRGEIRLRLTHATARATLLDALTRLAAGTLRPAMQCDGSRRYTDDPSYHDKDFVPTVPVWAPFSSAT